MIVLRKLGSGAFGSVYLVEIEKEDNLFPKVAPGKYALKIIEQDTEPADIKILKLLSPAGNCNPRISCIYDVQILSYNPALPASVISTLLNIIGLQESAKFTCILMEYIEGHELYEVVKAIRDKKAHPLSNELLYNFFYQMLDALEYIHSKNVVHRDIKPENIIYNERELKLVDFGLSCVVNKCPPKVLGTLDFMAPELFVNYDPTDSYWAAIPIDILKQPKVLKAVDIWAMGCVFYSLINGNDPFYARTKNETIETIIDSHPKQLRTIYWPLISAMLTYDYGNRPTATECKEVLESIHSKIKTMKVPPGFEKKN